MTSKFANTKVQISQNINNVIATPTQISTVTPTSTSIPTIQPTKLSSAKPTMITSISFIKIYANSRIISQSDGSVAFESDDSPDVITTFYKSLIEQSGSKVTSFVTTKTNGNVLNKLAGVVDNQSIEIEIKREKTESKTLVTASKK